jgi:hypothetical protein
MNEFLAWLVGLANGALALIIILFGGSGPASAQPVAVENILVQRYDMDSGTLSDDTEGWTGGSLLVSAVVVGNPNARYNAPVTITIFSTAERRTLVKRVDHLPLRPSARLFIPAYLDATEVDCTDLVITASVGRSRKSITIPSECGD